MSNNNKYDKLINIFEENNSELNFHNPKFEIAKSRILATMTKDNNTGVSFLIGDAGVGKSFLVKSLAKEISINHKVILITEFIHSEKELLQTIYKNLNSKSLADNIDVVKMRERVNESLRREVHILIVDKAHSLSIELLNRLAFGVSNKIMNLLLVFDDDSGKHLLSNGTLKSYVRNIIKIENLSLEDNENLIRGFLSSEELKQELLFLLKNNRQIHDFTKGNFASLKLFFKNFFSILSIAEKEKIKKYQKMNDCLLIMSALESNLIK